MATKTVKVYISYARVDRVLVDELKKHLQPLRSQGLINLWSDLEVAPGGDWNAAIDQHLNEADIILLMVSSDFLNSDYCYSREMQRVLERHAEGQARVIPIILRPVHWQNAPFGHLQVLPVGGQPVTREKIDEALRDIADNLQKIIQASFVRGDQDDHLSSVQEFPFIEGLGPDGQEFRVTLTKDRVTIGRFEKVNDVALLPDPQRLISRSAHCVLERDQENWWVVENGKNSAFVRRGSQVEVVYGRALLASGDSICILGRLTEEGIPLFWNLTFHDPLRTNVAGQKPHYSCLEYQWVEARLFRVNGSSRQEIHLAPLEHKLIRYMDQRNRANNNVPVVCAYEELLEALWDEDSQHTEDELRHLIMSLRNKVESDSKEPQFLQAVRGLGYRLVTNELSS